MVAYHPSCPIVSNAVEVLHAFMGGQACALHHAVTNSKMQLVKRCDFCNAVRILVCHAGS